MITYNRYSRQHRTIKGAIQKLYRSANANEKALSKFIDSKGNEVQAFVGSDLNFPLDPSSKDFLLFSYFLNKTLETIIMKETLNIKKIETLNYLNKTIISNCIFNYKLIEAVSLLVYGLLNKLEQGFLDKNILKQIEHQIYILIVQLAELLELKYKKKRLNFIQNEKSGKDNDYIKGLNLIIELIRLLLSKYPFVNEKYKERLREKLNNLSRMINELKRENYTSDESNNYKIRLNKNLPASPWIKLPKRE